MYGFLLNSRYNHDKIIGECRQYYLKLVSSIFHFRQPRFCNLDGIPHRNNQGSCCFSTVCPKTNAIFDSFLGIFIFVGCVAVGAVFADLCNKKETARKNPTVSRQFYRTGDIIRIISISCKKAAVSQSDSPTQRPFRFWLRLTTSVHRRLCVLRRPPAP